MDTAIRGEPAAAALAAGWATGSGFGRPEFQAEVESPPDGDGAGPGLLARAASSLLHNR